MNKTKLGVIAVIFALVVASCSSSDDDAEVATAVAEAPTESATADLTATATPIATATPESDCGVALLRDPDPEVETADIIARVVEGHSYCLRLSQASLNQEFTELYTGLTELHAALFGEGTYTKLVETYGSEAAFVLISATVIAFYAIETNTLTEIPNNSCSIVEDEFSNTYTVLYMLYTGILLDEVIACVRQASTSERQQAITDLAGTFGEEAMAKLIELYGVEATIAIRNISWIFFQPPVTTSPGESNCDPRPERNFEPDVEITDAIAIVVDELILCFRQLPQASLSQELSVFTEFAAAVLGEETYVKLVETYGIEATLIVAVSYLVIVVDARSNEDSRETVTPTEISSNFCSTVEDEFSDADTVPDIGTLLDEVIACVRQASTSERQQAITDLDDTFGEEAMAKLIELYGVEATIAISDTFGIALSLFPLQRNILKS